MSVVTAAKLFRHVHGLAARMPDGVERCPVVEAARLDDKRVALPTSDRISQVRGKLEVLRELAPVHEDLAMFAIDFVQDDGLFRGLHEFYRLGQQPEYRPAVLAVADVVHIPLGVLA